MSVQKRGNRFHDDLFAIDSQRGIAKMALTSRSVVCNIEIDKATPRVKYIQSHCCKTKGRNCELCPELLSSRPWKWTQYETSPCILCLLNFILKGKFSSGIEGALASTLNRDFNWKQLSEIILCIFSVDVFKVYLSNIDSEIAGGKQKEKKGDFEYGAWAPHFIMIWNITVTVRYKFWRTYLF